MTQPPNQPYDPNQPYTPGQGYNPNQPYNPNQGYGFPQGQQPYDPAQAQQYAAQQQYAEQYEKPKKRFGVRQIISIVATVAVIAVCGWWLWQNFQRNEALQVGSCVVVTGKSDDAEVEKVDCSEKSKFSYEVSQNVSKSSDCPDNTVSYEISSRSRYGSTHTEKVVCLIPNLHQDVCYSTSSSATSSFDVADCSSARFKVTKRVDQANASCEADEQDVTYTTPARTYCLGEAN